MENAMILQAETGCCSRFDPGPWDGKVVTWNGKLFLKDRVRSVCHIPLNFGAVMKRSMALIEAAGAEPGDPVVLSDENSLWGADIYIAIAKPVPRADITALSGTFLTRVFEGPYRNARRWTAEMNSWVTGQGKAIRKLYFFYTTCPRCAKAYGANYVVLLAQV